MTDYNFQTPPPLPKENELENVSFSYSPSLERSLFTKVFAWMGGALFVTAVVALLVASSNWVFSIITNPILFWGFIIAELLVVIIMTARLQKMSFATAAVLMILYSVLNGVTLSIVFLAYSLGSIARVFFITAGMFALMAVIGAKTKRNLAPAVRYLMMALIGLILMSVVNIFLQSTPLDWIISGIGVVLFTILTAVDTNRIKHTVREMVAAGADTESLHKLALVGSLQLYLDFINLFLYLLRFFGSRD